MAAINLRIALLVCVGVIGALAFDSTTNWPSCDWTIYNQGACGSCYSFSSSETVSARLCIANVWNDQSPAASGSQTAGLSPTNLLTCPGTFMGDQSNPCEGGYISRALQFYAGGSSAGWCSTSDTPCDSGCMPYQMGGASPSFVNPGTCVNTCSGGQQMISLAGSSMRVINVPGTVAAVEAEIMQNGPVSAGIYPVCDAFQTYISELSMAGTPYPFGGNCDAEPNAGGHAIQIVGFETVNNVPSWKIRNSWGASAGYNGYFFLPQAAGPSNLNVLSNVWTVLAGSQTAANTGTPSSTTAPSGGATTAPPAPHTSGPHTTAPATTAPPASSGTIQYQYGAVYKSDDGTDDFAPDDIAIPDSTHQSVVILDYPASWTINDFSMGNDPYLVGATMNIQHPSEHPHVRHSIHHYLKTLNVAHNVTRILWAGRKVVAGALYTTFFNTLDALNRTYVHKVVSHLLVNGTHVTLSAQSMRTGNLDEQCTTSFAAETSAASSSSQTSGASGYSGGQVAGIAVGSVVAAAVVFAAVVMVLRRRSARATSFANMPAAQQRLLDEENCD